MSFPFILSVFIVNTCKIFAVAERDNIPALTAISS